MKKEYNLRERAEIVDIAIKCAKSLSAQPLIDYFQAKEYEVLPEKVDLRPQITMSDEVAEKIANTMDINSKRGTVVRLQMKDGEVFGGYDGDKKMAMKYLKFGEVYHVESTDVQNWHTDVYLEEVPGIPFNSVMFERVTYPPAVGPVGGPPSGTAEAMAHVLNHEIKKDKKTKFKYYTEKKIK